MKIRKANRAIHRDLGYFFVGMAIIYGVSGIAINHRDDWDPNYLVSQKSISLKLPHQNMEEKGLALFFLEQVDEQNSYRTHLASGETFRIFIKDGSLEVNLPDGEAKFETIRKRPVFYQLNFLHYNTPKKLWTWFSDLFAVGLIILAITGMFVLKGKNGITRRGAWITAAGIIIPLVLLFVYLGGGD